MMAMTYMVILFYVCYITLPKASAYCHDGNGKLCSGTYVYYGQPMISLIYYDNIIS